MSVPGTDLSTTRILAAAGLWAAGATPAVAQENGLGGLYSGGPGNDIVRAGDPVAGGIPGHANGEDSVYGGAGRDTANGGDGSDECFEVERARSC